jgi:hypothetical protein
MPIEINILVINDFLFQKEEQPEWPESFYRAAFTHPLDINFILFLRNFCHFMWPSSFLFLHPVKEAQK